jgi:lysophospholipase L1-like esterase
VLNPANADPVNCFAGESPLVCEYRAVRPAVAIIMLGTNDVPGTPASTFEANMRRVIETTISMGVIPVVSTIPPMHRVGIDGRVEEFNDILARLTREHDVPLLDYWSALQGLPNDGLGSDGVHPSWAPNGNSANFTSEYLQYGMTVRNLTALWALDAVWKFALHP